MRWPRRKALLGVILLAGCGGAEAAEWERVSSMPQRRSYVASAQIGDAIYTIGGMVGETGRPLATFTRYDSARDSWRVLPQLPEPTRAAAAAAVARTIYLVGGTTPEGNTSAVWGYDVAVGEWRPHAPLPGPVFNHAAVALDGKVWVLGGFREGRELDDVFVYDPRADAWSRGPPLPAPNHAFDVVAFRGEIWLIGGRRGEEVLRDVWILDPARRVWRRGPSMPKPMELLGASVVGDEIHAVWESTYQIYDASSGRWSAGPTPGLTRHALQTFHVDGALYAVAGCTTALKDTPVVERIAVR
jgi:hypothetical protein